MEISECLKKKILVVAYDSGAANQIYYFLKNYKKKFKTFAKGPAKKIFKKDDFHTLTEAIQMSDVVLTGTGWQSKLEVNAIKNSKKLGKEVISFIDESINFNHRFTLDKNFFFPNIIFTRSKEAYDKCKKLCPKEVKVIKTKDHFLDYVKKNKIKPQKKNIVYLSSNFDGIRSKQKRKNKTIDIKLLDIFQKKIKKHNYLKKEKIYLRLHPSENANKYLRCSNFINMNIEISKKTNLLDCLKNFKYAFGCETYGLVIAKNYGLNAYNNLICTPIKSNMLKKYNIKTF